MDLERIKTPLTAAVEAYNGILADARGFAEDIASTAEAEIDEKSDKWREGDKGEAAALFRDEWQNLSLDDVEIDLPEEITFDDPDHAAVLDGAPVEAEL